MTKIADTLDLLNIVVRNFAPEVTTAPPANPVVGQIWTDTTTLGPGATENAIARYWDGHRWARMDGGGDIPNGMIYDRHVNAAAAIAWSKIAYPTNLATTQQVAAVQSTVDALTTRVTTAEGTILSQGTRLTTAEGNIGTLQTDNTSNKNRISTNETDIATLKAYNPTEQTRVNNALAAKADLIGGKIPTSQIPEVSLVRPKVYASLSARDADNPNVQEGDLAIVTGIGTYVKDSTPTGWIQLAAPAGGASQSDLSAEVSRAQAAEAGLQTNINNEASTRTTADNALGTRIDTETTARTTADSVLDGRINTTNSNYAAADTVLQGNIDSEVTARMAAVTSEKNARMTADQTNADAITSEAGNRASADTALGTRIDNEVTARSTAVSSEATARSNADASIRTDFAAADNQVRTEFAAADVILDGKIAAKANDNQVVHITGSESVSGTKTFANAPLITSGGFSAGGDAKQTTPKSYVDSQDAAEAATRLAADNSLDGRITTNTTALTTLNSNSTVGGSVDYKADARIALARGAANGVAPLDSGSLIPAQYLPSIAVTNVRTVTDNAALAAVTGMDQGDITIVTSYTDAGDTSTGAGLAAFIYDGTAWKQLDHPADITLAELNAAINAAIATEVTNRNTAIAVVNSRVTGLVAGTGMLRTGDTFDVQGTANRITVTADNVDIASTYVGQNTITTVGTIGNGTWSATPVDIAHGGTGLVGGVSLAHLKTYLGLDGMTHKTVHDLSAMTPGTPYLVTHGLGTRNLTWSVMLNSTGEFVLAQVIATGVNTVTVKVDASITDAMTLTLVG